jgi:hypothetical protein
MCTTAARVRIHQSIYKHDKATVARLASWTSDGTDFRSLDLEERDGIVPLPQGGGDSAGILLAAGEDAAATLLYIRTGTDDAAVSSVRCRRS